MSPRVKSLGFKMPEPQFSSSVADLVIDLEYLRRQTVIISTESVVYEQLRNIFRDLDALASTRIDGNKTGLSKYLEVKAEDSDIKGHKTIEIDKLVDCTNYIDKIQNQIVYYSGFFVELHQRIRKEITKESTRKAGKYRRGTTEESKPPASSPPPHMVETYLDHLVSFINKAYPSKYDIIKILMVHQKFLWIHPFREANGLVSRLLSYAMLVNYGFGGGHDRIINASLGMCCDQDQYFYFLKLADSDKEKDIMKWLAYSMQGIRDNLLRMDTLLNYDYLKTEIIIPSLKHPIFDRLLNDQDRLVLKIAIEKQIFQAADIKVFFPHKHPTEISKILRWLRDKDLITSLKDNSRKYTINLENKYLIKPIVARLDKNGFLPFEK